MSLRIFLHFVIMQLKESTSCVKLPKNGISRTGVLAKSNHMTENCKNLYGDLVVTFFHHILITAPTLKPYRLIYNKELENKNSQYPKSNFIKIK